ncbi:uncharacterized protein LOC124156022 isoform X2 [Ischnura elegans]|uniref:uncharacterized protein LOC124156022 isoform X2 n=1 Tax=Ischnura elegans TaxID=197161 RepID=UPI001ED884DC|nr:uncharacterized protein LOC124156022 isoform X2 [Ischnura elegans]
MYFTAIANRKRRLTLRASVYPKLLSWKRFRRPPIYEENISLSRPYIQYVDRDEYSLYLKVSSESTKNVWKRGISNFENKKIGGFSKQARNVPNTKESPLPQTGAQQIGTCRLVNPPGISYVPSKPPGLNVEVPEFYPRQDDMTLGQEVSRPYFPSGSFADFPKSLFPYIGAANEDRKISFNTNVNSVNSPGHVSAAQKHNSPQHCMQSDFRGQTLKQIQQTYLQNQALHALQQQQQQTLQSHQPQPHNLPSNYVIPTMQKPQSPVFTGSEQPTVSGRQPMTSGTSLEHQMWMANFLRIYYQQQYYQALSQMDQSMHSIFTPSSLQYNTSELASQFPPKTNYEQKSPPKEPQKGDSTINDVLLIDKPMVEEKDEPSSSPPKSIPVYQRPPESYNFTLNDNNSRRRNGSGGGGGGAVLANLIVLTKGGGRWKSSRHQVPDHGPKEKIVKDNNCGKLEKSEIPGYDALDDKGVKSSAASCLPDISENLSLISSHETSLIDSNRNEDTSEGISTIVFESSSASSVVNVEMPNNASTVSPDTIDFTEAYSPSAGGGGSIESEFTIQAHLSDDRKGIGKTMTSTPIKDGICEVENADSLKWPDLTLHDEDVGLGEEIADQKKRNEEVVVQDTSAERSVKLVQASKSLELNFLQASMIKETISDPSFPPIRSKKSRSSRLKSAESVLAPALNVSSHRRLYSDVLSTRAGIVPSNCTKPPASEASSSIDSLEKRFKELEILAIEQYQSQSSLDSVSRIYHDLEMQAVEQYRSSCESETKIVAERSPISVKEGSTAPVKELMSSNSLSLDDAKRRPSSSRAGPKEGVHDNDPALIAPPQDPVVILHEVKNNENFKAAISSTSIDVVTNKTEIVKTHSVDGINAEHQPVVKSETELLAREGKPPEEVTSQVSCPNISSHRLRNKPSKSVLKANKTKNKGKCHQPDQGSTNTGGYNGNAGGTQTSGGVPTKSTPNQLPTISQPVNREGSTGRLSSALHEAPNEQRTQASTTAGTKSEGRKESPTQGKGTGVPEAWVPNLVHDDNPNKSGENADKNLSDRVKNKSAGKKGASIESNKSQRTSSKNNLAQGATQTSQTCTLPGNCNKNLGKTVSASNLNEKPGGRGKKKAVKDLGLGAEASVPEAKLKEKSKSSLEKSASTEDNRNKSDRKKKDALGQKSKELESLLTPTQLIDKLRCGVTESLSVEQRGQRSEAKTALRNLVAKSCENLKISAVKDGSDKDKCKYSKKEKSLDQVIEEAKTQLLLTKSKKNSEHCEVEKNVGDKNDSIGDDSKRGSNKKRRRGNRRRNRKALQQETGLDAEATKAVENHCENTLEFGKGDTHRENMIESVDIDSSVNQNEPFNAKLHVENQSISMPCARNSLQNISLEKNGIADKAHEDTASNPIKCSSECGIFEIHDKGVSGKRKKRNRKAKASKSSEDVFPLNISGDLSHVPKSTLLCNKMIDNKKLPILADDISCQENYRQPSRSISAKTLKDCDEVEKLPSENCTVECNPNTHLTKKNSSIEFEFSVSPPETMDELHCDHDELLGPEDISLNLGCSSTVGEMAALISRRIKRGKKSKLQKKRLVQDNLGCEIFEDCNPLNDVGATGRGSENASFMTMGIGCRSSTMGDEDIETQLLIPSLCEDPCPESICDYEFAKINVEDSPFRSVEIQSCEDNIESHLGCEKRVDTVIEFGENSGSSFVPLGSHFGSSAHSSVIVNAPTLPNQGMMSQYTSMSLSRTSNESTPRTPQSTESGKSTSSSPSVLSKLMRSSKKTRKSKAAGSGGVCSRSPPSCALQ